MIQVNEEIQEKASKILSSTQETREYIRTCIKALICPKCGARLISAYSNSESPFEQVVCENTRTQKIMKSYLFGYLQKEVGVSVIPGSPCDFMYEYIIGDI